MSTARTSTLGSNSFSQQHFSDGSAGIIRAGRTRESSRISFASKYLCITLGRILGGIRACQIVHIISDPPTKSPQKHSTMTERIGRLLDNQYQIVRGEPGVSVRCALTWSLPQT